MLLALAAGCGELSKPAGPPHGSQISEADVTALPAGSPEQAVVEWLRLMQQNELAEARRYLPPGTIGRLEELKFIRQVAVNQWRLMGMPKIIDVTRRGRTATVYVMTLTEREAPNGRRDVVRRPRAFHLVRGPNGWRLADDLFLATLSDVRIDPALKGMPQ
ncbi:MAG: hypothetical protein JW895_06065 [Thermoleophilaceae bacterium]|nr:hypothetical protein [Thermoleophilaceae bacterium]